METKTEPKNGKMVSLAVMSELMNRMSFASKLGTDTYSGARDVYTALGYPKQIQSQDYWNRYERQDIAKAIIDRPVKASWKGVIDVIENIKPVQTQFEKAWTEIYERLKLKSVFIRADKLTGMGEYSIILLGLSDAKSVEQYKTPVSKTAKPTLVFIKPLSQESATISSYIKDPTNERFGLPEFYDVKVTEKGSATSTSSFKVHHTRVVHLVEDILEDETKGTPRLRAVYNRLIDLEKVIGGDAEMFWRGARPGYTGNVDKDYQMTPEAFAALQEEIDEFENNLRRILVNEGVTYKELAQQIADPINHVDVLIQMISAVTGVPKRILMGSERGELSSAQDKQEWISYVTSRREEQNEPMILRPFIDKCIDIGVLPKPAVPYIIVWDKLFSLSDSEKVSMGKDRASALKEYTTNPITAEVMPLELFAEYFLAFDKTQVDRIMEYTNEEILSEMVITPAEQALMDKEAATAAAEVAAKANPTNPDNPNPAKLPVSANKLKRTRANV